MALVISSDIIAFLVLGKKFCFYTLLKMSKNIAKYLRIGISPVHIIIII